MNVKLKSHKIKDKSGVTRKSLNERIDAAGAWQMKIERTFFLRNLLFVLDSMGCENRADCNYISLVNMNWTTFSILDRRVAWGIKMEYHVITGFYCQCQNGLAGSKLTTCHNPSLCNLTSWAANYRNPLLDGTGWTGLLFCEKENFHFKSYIYIKEWVDLTSIIHFNISNKY